MVNEHIAAALNELEAERSAAVEEIMQLERRREDRLTELQRLDSAIQSLRELYPGTHAGNDPGQSPATESFEVPQLRNVPAGPKRLEPFITRGVGSDKEGLQSAHMVAAVVDAIAEPVPREKLQKAFFQYFDRDLLKTYWQQPDKAFRSALQRAVERDLINEVKYPNDGGVVYIGGFRAVEAGRSASVEPLER